VATSADAIVKAHQRVADAQYALGGANRALVAAHKGVEDAAYREARAHDAITAAQDASRTSAEKLRDAKEKLAKAQEADSRSFEGNSQAAQDNREKLQTLWDVISKTGGSTQEHLTTLVDIFTHSTGLSRDTVEDLAHKLLGIPPDIHANVALTANGIPLLLIPGVGYVAQLPPSYGPGGPAGTGTQTFGLPTHPMSIGGLVAGPGDWTSDSILARLSNGEFVVRAAPTARHLDLLQAINAEGFADGGLVGFAGGGVVTPPLFPTLTPAAPGAPDPTAQTTAALTVALADLQKQIALTVTALLGLMQANTDLGVNTLALGQKLAGSWTQITGTVTAAQNTIATGQARFYDQLNLSWAAITLAVSTSVTNQGTALRTLDTALGTLQTTITQTADLAVTQFLRVFTAAADPIRAVLTGPINGGLIGAWNSLDTQFSFNRHVDPVPIPFATGGPVTGPGTGTSDSILARLSAGEYVIPAAVTAKTRPFLDALRDGQAEALEAAGYRNSYATGGLVANTGSELNATIVRGQQWLQQQAGKPYIWGGAGPVGYDCSGLVAALINVLRGESNPYHRLGTTLTMPWPGFTPGLTSAMSAGWNAQHMAGTLGGVNLEARDFGIPVMVGGPAAGADSSQFSGRASLPVVGGKFVSGGNGATFDPTAMIASAFAGAIDQAGAVSNQFPGNVAAQDGAALARQAIDKVKQVALDKVSASSIFGGSGPAIGGDAGAAQAYARTQLPRFGWGPEQMNSLIPLWEGESNWLWWKINKDSGAGGIPQALPATKMADVSQGGGPDWRTNPSTQINWGLQYIRDRPDYGSPAAAYSKWLARSPHWYDQGGWLMPGGAGANGLSKPEAVLTPEESAAYVQQAKSATAGGEVHYHLTVHNAGNNEINLKAQFKRMEIESGML
jgi:cell wall-associated NlpC family hydrolase